MDAIKDEVVTHDEVLRWQSESIRREWAEAERAREMAMPPEERGWATEAEAATLPGEWIAVPELGSAEVRYLRGRP